MVISPQRRCTAPKRTRKTLCVESARSAGTGKEVRRPTAVPANVLLAGLAVGGAQPSSAVAHVKPGPSAGQGLKHPAAVAGVKPEGGAPAGLNLAHRANLAASRNARGHQRRKHAQDARKESTLHSATLVRAGVTRAPQERTQPVASPRVTATPTNPHLAPHLCHRRRSPHQGRLRVRSTSASRFILVIWAINARRRTVQFVAFSGYVTHPAAREAGGFT